MRRRLGLLLTLVAIVGPALVAQQQTKPRLLVVTLGGAYVPDIRAWRRDPVSGAFAPVWQASPLTVDDETYRAWGRETIPWSAGLPVIADYDGDGVSDLLVIDRLGLTVYGRSPAYFPFSVASGVGNSALIVADVDGDGQPEVVTERSTSYRTSDGGDRRAIEIWRKTARGLQLKWRRELDGSSFGLQWADADNDGENELITASDTVVILKRGADGGWDIGAELPNVGLPQLPGEKDAFTLIDVVRVADVDGDGKNEILATGNSGRLTIYTHRRQRFTGREDYPVLWQSSRLMSEGLMPSREGSIPLLFSQGLAVGDLDGGGGVEILVGTMESGIRPGEAKALFGGRIHLFRFDGRGDFTRVWLSDWTRAASIPAFAVADLDGDGRNEFVYHGQFVYSYDSDAKTYSARTLCSECSSISNAVIGELPELGEPTTAVRIAPVRSSLPRQGVAAGQSAEVTLTLRSVWAEAKDVTVAIAPADARLTIEKRTLRVSVIPAGGTAALPPFTLRIAPLPAGKEEEKNDMVFADLRLDITAAGCYVQSVPLTVTILRK